MPCQSSGEVVANMTFFDRTHVISCQALLAAYTYNLFITLAMINGSMLLAFVKCFNDSRPPYCSHSPICGEARRRKGICHHTSGQECHSAMLCYLWKPRRAISLDSATCGMRASAICGPATCGPATCGLAIGNSRPLT